MQVPTEMNGVVHQVVQGGAWRPQEGHMPRMLDLSMVAAIKAALGLPAGIEGAVPIIGMANEIMGIVLDRARAVLHTVV